MTSLAQALIKLIAATLIIILILFAATRGGSQTPPETGENAETGLVMPDMTFFSAEDVTVRVNSTDDVFAAGGTVRVDQTSADHLVLAGGEISVADVSIQDLFAAGGTIKLVSGAASDDIVAAGGEIDVEPGFSIGSSAVLTGGEVRVETPVPADLRVGAANAYVNSPVGGDARLSGELVTLGPKARIEGDLFYRTENLVLEPGAVVTGRQVPMPETDRSAMEEWGQGAGRLFATFALSVLVGFTVLVMVIAVAVPALMRSASDMIRQRPLQSLGIGALIAVGAPFLIFLLFASVVGAPLAMLVAAICISLTPIAIAATAYFVGMEARRIATKQTEPPAGILGRLLWPGLGAAIVLILGLIPLAGLLVWILALLFGLGAIATRGGKALAVAT
ncbi:hypothetical protein GRI43_12800 [Altererythrobacter luteolus]|uniref:DUF8173 domain-containing protein n=1 Tax=Pontixanthobacter luteolus TaxID=295089 RepID=A0A6I4V275_9SPHN|nr:polymer-forming cytoskeletal protein [Pontixanthobacter luteolus]MXP48267.1 hypothetical protein [Pontixanthobacter luteolus]